MSNTASVLKNEISVRHSVRPDVGREYLTISISGWEELEPLTKRVLLFDGRRFTFTGWNSDTNEAYFCRGLGQSDEPTTARIV